MDKFLFFFRCHISSECRIPNITKSVYFFTELQKNKRVQFFLKSVGVQFIVVCALLYKLYSSVQFAMINVFAERKHFRTTIQ